MNYLINHNKRILYYLGIVIIFLLISVYQSGFYHNVVIEVLAESNTNELCDKSLNSEKDSSWMIVPWVKYPHNPILTAGDYDWESKNVLNPTAIVKDGKVYLFYRAQNDKRISCIGLAISDDGYMEMVNWIPSTMVNRNPMVMVNKIPIRMVNRIPILEKLLYSFRKLIQERGNEKEKNVSKNTII